jgi:hypothetical protein
MSSFEEMDKIVQEYGRDGLRFLFLFKILKSQIEVELKKQACSAKDSDINQVCAEAASKLLVSGEDKPTENALEKILSRLKGQQ